jgi:hypothetical protein
MSDSDGDVEPYRMPKPSDRAKKADVIIALRSSVQCFVEANNATFPNPQGRDIIRYCDYASRFIAPIWHNSVRKLLSEECERNDVDKGSALLYKNRVTGYMRTFLPTNNIQNLPKPMGIYFSAFRQSEGPQRGLSFPGPVGKFLNDHLVSFIRNRSSVTLDAQDLRHAYMQARLQTLMQQEDFDLEAMPECLRKELLGVADDENEDEESETGAAESGGDKRQRRRIAKGDVSLFYVLSHNTTPLHHLALCQGIALFYGVLHIHDARYLTMLNDMNVEFCCEMTLYHFLLIFFCVV